MKTLKSDLLTALQKVMPGIGKDKMALEGADTVVFSQAGIHTYNDNISVTVPFPGGDLVGAVKGEKLYKLIQKLKTPDIELKVKDNQMTVISGGTKAALTMVESGIGALVKSLHSLSPSKALPEDFHEALTHCSIRGNASPFAGVVIDKSTMISTDQRRSNYYAMAAEMAAAWLSQPNVEELLRIIPAVSKLTHYELADVGAGQWVHFRASDGTIFSCALKDMSVYPVAQLLGQRDKINEEAEEASGEFPDGFAEVIDRCTVLASQSETTGLSFVSLIFSSDKITISGKQAAGSIEEQIKWKSPAQLETPVKTAFSSDFLIQAVSKVKKFTLKSIGGKSPYGNRAKLPVVVLSNEKFTHIMAGLVD